MGRRDGRDEWNRGEDGTEGTEVIGKANDDLSRDKLSYDSG